MSTLAYRSVFVAIAFGCSVAPAVAPTPVSAPGSKPKRAPTAAKAPPNPGLRSVSDRPWWQDLRPGVYRRREGPAVMAVGRSVDHHHPAEGFLQAKVRARLATRRAAGVIAFQGAMPGAYLEDLFIAPDNSFMALYRLDVPGNAGLPDSVADWTPPARIRQLGRRRIGRHMFEDAQHLYLECDVEGPVANPDWGQTRATAQYEDRSRAGAHRIVPPRRTR